MDRLDDGHFREAGRDAGFVLGRANIGTVSKGRLMRPSNPWHVCHSKEGRIGQLCEHCRGFWIDDDGVFEDVVCREVSLLQISFLAPSTTSVSISVGLDYRLCMSISQSCSLILCRNSRTPTCPSGFGWVKFCSDAPDHLRIPGVTLPPQFSEVLFMNDSG